MTLANLILVHELAVSVQRYNDEFPGTEICLEAVCMITALIREKPLELDPGSAVIHMMNKNPKLRDRLLESRLFTVSQPVFKWWTVQVWDPRTPFEMKNEFISIHRVLGLSENHVKRFARQERAIRDSIDFKDTMALVAEREDDGKPDEEGNSVG